VAGVVGVVGVPGVVGVVGVGLGEVAVCASAVPLRPAITIRCLYM
jgi:hypothetical protein